MPHQKHNIIKSRLDLDYFNNELEQYNGLLNFVATSDPPQQYLDQCQSSVNASCEAIETVLREAQEKIAGELQKVRRQHESLVRKVILQDKTWYRRANVLSLEYEELDEMLNTSPIKDPADFALHHYGLYSAMIRWLKCDDGRARLSMDTLRTLMRLHRAIQDSPADTITEHTLRYDLLFQVFIICKIAPNVRATGDNAAKIDIIRQLHASILGCAPDAGHWDFAMARREMWATYAEFQLEDFDYHAHLPTARHDPRATQCIHQELLHLLGTLNGNAQDEVRGNVCLAVGRWLPPELAELVYEETMALEEVPLDCTVLVDPGSRAGDLKNVREEYRCQCWINPIVRFGDGYDEEGDDGDDDDQ